MESRVLREASWSWENEWAKLMCHHYDSKSNCAEDGSVADTARIGTAAVAHSSCSLLACAMKQSNSRWVNADGRMPSSTLAAQIRASITATQEKAMVLQTREVLHKRCRANATAATTRINFIATTTSMGVGVPASTIKSIDSTAPKIERKDVIATGATADGGSHMLGNETPMLCLLKHPTKCQSESSTMNYIPTFLIYA